MLLIVHREIHFGRDVKVLLCHFEGELIVKTVARNVIHQITSMTTTERAAGTAVMLFDQVVDRLLPKFTVIRFSQPVK